MTPIEIYRLLREADFSPDEATTFVAIAMAESGGKPGALNDRGEYSTGLFQINTADGANEDLRGLDLTDPLENARAAKRVYDRQGIQAWTVTHRSKGSRYLSYVADAVNAARLVEGSMGVGDDGYLYNPKANWDGTAGYGGAPVLASGAGIPNGMEPQDFQRTVAPVRQADTSGGGFSEDVYPAGAEHLSHNGQSVLRYEAQPGVWVEWLVSDTAALERSGYGAPTGEYYEPAEGFLVDYTESGDASELGDITHDSVRSWFDEKLGVYFSPNDPARNDPEIMWVVARIIANPDTDTAVIQSWIRNTDYWNSTTATAAEWSGLSQAEQAAQIATQAAAVTDEFWRLTGERISPDDPRAQEWGTMIASGQQTYSWMVFQVQDLALANPESPFSRSIRNEEIAQGQWGVDLEDSSALLTDQALDWGVQLSSESINDWAEQIARNESSQADFDEFLKDQAEILYPWKNRETMTSTAASPWINSYSRIMETGNPELTDVDVQQALQSGESLYDFEKRLRTKPEWMETKNATDSFTAVGSNLARQMGFE